MTGIGSRAARDFAEVGEIAVEAKVKMFTGKPFTIESSDFPNHRQM